MQTPSLLDPYNVTKLVWNCLLCWPAMPPCFQYWKSPFWPCHFYSMQVQDSTGSVHLIYWLKNSKKTKVDRKLAHCVQHYFICVPGLCTRRTAAKYVLAVILYFIHFLPGYLWLPFFSKMKRRPSALYNQEGRTPYDHKHILKHSASQYQALDLQLSV